MPFRPAALEMQLFGFFDITPPPQVLRKPAQRAVLFWHHYWLHKTFRVVIHEYVLGSKKTDSGPTHK